MNAKLRTNQHTTYRAIVLALSIALIVLTSKQMRADTGMCGGASSMLPFTDVAGGNIFFCSIASAYFTGLTSGTTPTTYSPAAPVPREQMAAFITRTMDQSLRRGNRRAALQQWWQPTTDSALRPTSVGDVPAKLASDGADIWVASHGEDAVIQVQGSNGKLLAVHSQANGAHDVVVAAGVVFITGLLGPGTPGKVYVIQPQEEPDPVTVFADTGPNPTGITFDGTNLWTANNAGGLAGGSITKIPFSQPPTTFAAGFTAPADVLWDGEKSMGRRFCSGPGQAC